MKKALEPLILAWRVPDLRNRLLFILGAIIVYVTALHIPIPNADPAAIERLFNSSAGVLGFIDTFGGGALRKLSILALGIMPYITSSIVFQILTIAFPKVKELQQEGEYGRRKIAQWTRWAAIGLTLVQAFIATKAFQSEALQVLPSGFAIMVQSVMSLTAGTMFLIWLGEQMTTRGIGNGISFIIFAGIVARLPINIAELIELGKTDTSVIVKLVLMLIIFIATIYAVITVTQGERRIPVKYAPRQAGQRMVQGQRSFLPLKLAAAGVIPIIFAVSIVLFPGQIATWYLQANADQNTTLVSIAEGVQYAFSPSSWIASLLYAGMVMLFTYFYTAVLFDVRDLSDNLKRYGGQIQGYAPGRPTEIYINRVLTRITFAGGVFLASLALMQWWMPTILQLPATSGAGGSLLVGGTSLLIVVGVALEIMQNLDQQLKMRQYEGLSKSMGKGKL
jgi:preprotein translocase subunit SecY